MITDSKTNTVYLAEGLKHYERFCYNLLSALDRENINVRFLPQTNSIKHIWARDYMPVQLDENRFLQYDYKPDYLSGYEGYIPDTSAIVKNLGLDCIYTDIIIDGGNVIKCGNKVIMTDKIFKENPGYGKAQLVSRLENLLGARLIIIPWDRYEIYGHADGMVRYVKDSKVLLNNYADFDEDFGRSLLEALSPHFEIAELKYGNRKCSKDSWAYINFLHVGNCIFVPKLNIREDRLAAEQIQSHYPGCKIIMIDGAEQVVKKGGALNCISWNIYSEVNKQNCYDQ